MGEYECEQCSDDFDAEEGYELYCPDCWEFIEQDLNQDQRARPEDKCSETEDMFE